MNQSRHASLVPSDAQALIDDRCGAIRIAEYMNSHPELTRKAQDAIWVAWTDRYDSRPTHVARLRAAKCLRDAQLTGLNWDCWT